MNYLTNNARILLIILAAGTPGLLVQDSTGLTNLHGLFSLSNVWRMAVYIGVFYYFLIFFLFVSSRASIKFPEGAGLKAFFLLYSLLFCSYPFLTSNLSLISFMEASYRLFEWFTILLLVLFSLPNAHDAPTSEVSFVEFVKKLIFTIFLVVLFMAIIRPDLGFTNFPSGFGGFLLHPNKLSLICAIGVLFCGVYRKTRIDNLAILLFIICGYATGSRSGLAMIMLSLIFVIISSGNRDFKIIKILSLIVLAFVGGLYLLADIASFSSLAFLTRGGGIENLINMNNRLFVWEASWSLFLNSPWLGGGYLDASAHISDYVNQSWWKPPHAHNDILQFLISGGVVAGGLSIYIYTIPLFKLRKGLSSRKINLVLFATITLCLIHSVVELLLSFYVSPASIIFIIAIRYAGLINKRKKHL